MTEAQKFQLILGRQVAYWTILPHVQGDNLRPSVLGKFEWEDDVWNDWWEDSEARERALNSDFWAQADQLFENLSNGVSGS